MGHAESAAHSLLYGKCPKFSKVWTTDQRANADVGVTIHYVRNVT